MSALKADAAANWAIRALFSIQFSNIIVYVVYYIERIDIKQQEKLERRSRLELETYCLASSHSTTELTTQKINDNGVEPSTELSPC